MRSCRRRAISLVLVIGALGLVLVGLGLRRGQPQLELIFLGYSNQPVVVVSGLGRGQPRRATNLQPAAMFLATNSGPRRIRIEDAISFNGGMVLVPGGTRMGWSWTGPELNPGESVSVTSQVNTFGESFRVRIRYADYGFRERWSARLQAGTNAFAQALGRRLSTRRPALDAYSEWLVPPLADAPEGTVLGLPLTLKQLQELAR